MSEDSMVVAAFVNGAAAWRGVNALHDLGGVVMFASAVFTCDDGRCTVVAADQGQLSLRLAHLLTSLVVRTESGSHPTAALTQCDPVNENSNALVGVLGILPRGHAAIVAEVFEAAPLRLERTIAAFGGRVLHRRPPRRWAKAEGPVDDDGPDATELRITALQRRIVGATGADKALFTKRLEELRSS